jgi:hypothetical protein
LPRPLAVRGQNALVESLGSLQAYLLVEASFRRLRPAKSRVGRLVMAVAPAAIICNPRRLQQNLPDGEWELTKGSSNAKTYSGIEAIAVHNPASS